MQWYYARGSQTTNSPYWGWENDMSRWKLFCAGALISASCLTFSVTSHAQAANSNPPAVSPQDLQVPSDQEIDLLRKDIRSQKKQLIAQNMKLSDAEAQKFWPVYDRYTTDLVKINNTKYDLIKRYLQTYTTMTDSEAEAFVKQWGGFDEQVIQLRLQYVPEFRKVLSAKNTLLFYQLDRRIQMMIDLQLSSQVPLAQ
jgi:hypothetical protein